MRRRCRRLRTRKKPTRDDISKMMHMAEKQGHNNEIIARATGWHINTVRKICGHIKRPAKMHWFDSASCMPRALVSEEEIAALYAGMRYEDDPAAVRDNRTIPITISRVLPRYDISPINCSLMVEA